MLLHQCTPQLLLCIVSLNRVPLWSSGRMCCYGDGQWPQCVNSQDKKKGSVRVCVFTNINFAACSVRADRLKFTRVLQEHSSQRAPIYDPRFMWKCALTESDTQCGKVISWAGLILRSVLKTAIVPHSKYVEITVEFSCLYFKYPLITYLLVNIFPDPNPSTATGHS